MEILDSKGAILFTSIFLVLYAWKFFNWVWLKPRKLEKYLRHQGFTGNSYRFMIGDYKDIAAMAKDAQSKPISPLSNDIMPRVMPFIHQTVINYGRNSFLWFGPNPTVLISEPELIKEVLSRNTVFQKTSSPYDKLLAQGIAAYEKDKWAKHRKLINPAFNVEKLKLMLPSFYTSCFDMLSKWEGIVSSQGGSCELDVWPYLQAMTSDAISRTAFGSNYEEGRKIFELQKEQGHLFVQALQSLYIPGWRFLPTKLNRKMKEIAKEVESSILGVINKRMRVIEAGEANSDDLLGMLLESNFNEVKQHGNESRMSLKEVIEECKLFYIAGQETTSSMLLWTMILLSQHLDWQARAREEVVHIFGKGKPDYQGLNHLKTVTMIFHEVLRLYPPAVMLGRMTHEETKLGSIILPAGLQIFLPALLIHQDRDLWRDDSKEFKPERFSEGVLKATKRQFSYLPFGGGPRICIGQNFAMLEAKMALAMILQQYSFELSPSYTHSPETVLILQPQHGAQLILHKL
uniref:Cytochrome P450 n=1 Tax=Scoparia dulcis TaxID=107240 RepID=A0A1W7HBW8_SCODU